MSRRKTGRTEGIYIKVNPEIKEQIQSQMKSGFNLTEAFEQLWYISFPTKQNLLQEQQNLSIELERVENRLAKMQAKEELEASLTLDDKGIAMLVSIVRKFIGNDAQQCQFFNCLASKQLSQEHYNMLRKKYLTSENIQKMIHE